MQNLVTTVYRHTQIDCLQDFSEMLSLGDTSILDLTGIQNTEYS